MIYVMGDIHGNQKRFDSVMEKIKLQPGDTLYVLGDVIDRHAAGIKILRTLMRMGNVRLLLGNHEYMMLNALDATPDNRALAQWYNNGGRVTHEYLKRSRLTVRMEIFEYLRSLPLNIDVTVNGIDYKLVHGAPVELFGKYVGGFKDETEFAVWKRWDAWEFIPMEYTMIFGHTPTFNYQPEIPLSIWSYKNNIGIDCGSGFPEIKRYGGRLACLRLDDMKEFYSEEMEDENCEQTTNSSKNTALH